MISIWQAISEDKLNTLIDIQQISKKYGNLKALDNISLSIQKGEIIGVVGRRGAGKTTILNVIGGVTKPSGGEIDFCGETVEFSSPYESRTRGVELVHQNPQLVEEIDVIHNIFLGHEISQYPSVGLPDQAEMTRIASQLIEKFELPEHFLNISISEMTDEYKHLIALMRAFSQPYILLLLDDVLPNLSYHRQEILLKLIRERAETGAGTIICSNDLNLLFSITNRILVILEGRLIADVKTSECSLREIVELTVGANTPEQVTPVIWALENYQKAEQQTEQLFLKQMEMHESLEASDQLNKQLIAKLSDQVKAMNRLNYALQETQKRLMTEREEERKALARELHDSIIQDLLGLNYRIEDLELTNSSTDSNEDLIVFRRDVRQAVSDLRQVCRDLRPPTIDNHGLSSAIPSLVQEWEERTGILVGVKIQGKFDKLPEWIELSIFRIIQEGLNNVAKHSKAKNVDLRLIRHDEGILIIRITDDGQGMDFLPNLADLTEQKHYGLVGISERVALCDGKMSMTSPENSGFVLEVELPNPNPFE